MTQEVQIHGALRRRVPNTNGILELGVSIHQAKILCLIGADGVREVFSRILKEWRPLRKYILPTLENILLKSGPAGLRS